MLRQFVDRRTPFRFTFHSFLKKARDETCKAPHGCPRTLVIDEVDEMRLDNVDIPVYKYTSFPKKPPE